MREPGAKEAVRKVKKPHEVHYDDCGEDDSSICLFGALSNRSDDDVGSTTDGSCGMPELTDSDSDDELELSHVNPYFGLRGSEATDADDTGGPDVGGPREWRYESVDHFLTEWHSDRAGTPGAEHSDAFDDDAEICGGGAFTTELLVQRQYRGGRNLDIRIGCDLTTPEGQQSYWRYARRAKPYIVIMSPPCTGLMGWKSFNRVQVSL